MIKPEPGSRRPSLARVILDAHGTQFAGLMLGVVAWRQEKHEEAVHLCEESADFSRALGDQWGLAWSLIIQGHDARRSHDLERAEPLYREGLEISEPIGQAAGVIWALHGLAGVALELGDPSLAARRFGLANRVALTVGFPNLAVSASYEQDFAATSAALGDRDFARAWREGSAMEIIDVEQRRDKADRWASP